LAPLGQASFFDYTASVHARLHRFLLMLLMLALPLQTFASASMLGCDAARHPAAEQMVMAAGNAADEMKTDCHAHEQPSAPLAQHNCKHCAACTLASALPIPVTDLPAIMPVSNSFTPQFAESFSGFIPDGPERPPQSPLA
jgi:hypothetical protein